MPASPAPVTHLNLRLLQTFMLVAEYQSFREAAEQTHRSQSAVSTQIKQLEEQLGIKLLYRTTRSVKLTDEGAELFAGIKRGMYEIGLGLRSIQETADIKRGKVALACSPTVAATSLPRILAVFEKDYPAVHIHLSELHSIDIFHAVRQGDVDFGIGPKIGATAEGLHFDIILDDPLMALTHRSLVSRKRTEITLADLAAMPLLLHSSAAATRQLLDEAQRSSGIVITGKYECTQMQTLVAMAEAGLGTAIIPKSVIREAHAPSTKALRIVKPAMSRQVAIVTALGRPLSPAAGRLAQLIRELIGE
jgi:DNA-binding transcriptional LysR family regulator